MIRMHWCLSHRADPLANAVAKRHYNCQSPESDQFMPPGRCMVLLATQKRKLRRAVWGTSFPMAEFVKHRWAGAWVNSLFRNETFWPSPELIREAIACNRWYARNVWFLAEPALGMITFVDTTKVKPKEQFGKCYIDAGFREVGYTEGGLLALQMLPEDMPAPALPNGAQLTFEGWEAVS